MVLFKNAFFNLLRGGVGALVALLLPSLLVRTLSKDEYSVWVLVLQLGAYVGYLDFGVQTAVGRFVAQAHELGDVQRRNGMASAAWIFLLTAAAGGVLLVALLGWLLPAIFPQMPLTLLDDARIAYSLIGGSLALALPFSVSTGVFVGLERNEVPALLMTAGKILSAALVVLAATAQAGLVWMCAGWATATAATAAAQWLALRKLAPDIRIHHRLASRALVRELASYCLGLSVLTVAMLLIAGLDTVIVGAFDYPAVASYSIAGSMVIFVGALQTAIFSPLIPRAAAIHARKDATELGNLLVSSTRYGVLLLLLTVIPLTLFAGPILTIWVGKAYAEQAQPVLIVLAIANAIRWSFSPYANILIGTGQQRIILLTPLIESVVNLLASLILVTQFGAIGVAYGTLIGTIASFLGNTLINMPATRDISFHRRELLMRGFLQPMSLMLPGVAILSLTVYFAPAMPIYLLGVVTALIITTLIARGSGLIPPVRRERATG